ncbi:hypothetical protein RHS01_09996 [Rhizoctonia solani]|uniref:Uncharacterized protein n=1 Tax=Rhizoctonia solani TaxID=456999 RepID=A0A8H7I5Z5_9AGAM|nr:hypothetical protein RHS01_09996 [Rhizoctonia solani]
MTGSATARTTTETFSSVEFVLMLLSMYACVTKEVRTTVMFLLEIVFGYEPLRRRYGREPRLHEVQTLFEPLLELARIHGAEYKREDIQTKEDEQDAMGMVTGILRPILIRLSVGTRDALGDDRGVDVRGSSEREAAELAGVVADVPVPRSDGHEARGRTEGGRDCGAIRVWRVGGSVDGLRTSTDRASGEAAAGRGRGGHADGQVGETWKGATADKTVSCGSDGDVADGSGRWTNGTGRTSDDKDESGTIRAIASRVGRRCGSGDESEERMEREGLEKYKYGGVALDSAEERTTTVDSSDSEWTADSWETSSGLEETWKIQTSQTWPCLDTTTIKGSSLELINECSLVGSQSAPGLTNAAREYSRSELATRGTYGALDGLSGQCDLSRAFSIRSGPWTASMESDTSDWSLQLDWLEHEDDSCVMSRGGWEWTGLGAGVALELRLVLRLGSDSNDGSGSGSDLGTSVESLFDGWASDWQSDWQSDQLWMWKCAIDEDHAARAQEEAAAEQYAWWASDWERRELDEWRKGMEREVEVRVDRKRRRVEMTGPVEKCAGRLVKKIRYALGF